MNNYRLKDFPVELRDLVRRRHGEGALRVAICEEVRRDWPRFDRFATHHVDRIINGLVDAARPGRPRSAAPTGPARKRGAAIALAGPDWSRPQRQMKGQPG